MALIKCPECGKEISSKAKTCVHCGCEVFLCPECGTAYSEKLQTCKVCGYEFEKTPSIPIAKQETESANDLNEFLVAQKKKHTKRIYVFLSLFACFVVFFALAMFLPDIWAKKEPFEQLVKLTSFRNGTFACTILAAIFFAILMIVGDICDCRERNVYIGKLQGRQDEYRKLLLIYDTDEDKQNVVIENCANAIYKMENENESKQLSYIEVISTILALLIAIFFVVFWLRFTDISFSARALGIDLDFDMIEREWSFYVAICCVVIDIIFDIFASIYKKNKMKKLKERFQKELNPKN